VPGTHQGDLHQSRYRHAFYGRDATVPGLKHFGEYTAVTPADGGGTRIVWKFALQMGGVALPAPISSRVAALAFGSVKRDTVRHFGG